MKKKFQSVSIVFYALIIVFIFLLCQFFVPWLNEMLRGAVFMLPMIIFALLGGALLFLTLKKKVKKPLKTYLILAGASSAGFLVFSVLHNVFYALAIITGNILILRYLMEFLHVGFFLIATLVCLIGILIGMIGSIILLIKKK